MVKIQLIPDKEKHRTLTLKQFSYPEFIFLNLGLIFYYGKSSEEINPINDAVQYHQGEIP